MLLFVGTSCAGAAAACSSGAHSPPSSARAAAVPVKVATVEEQSVPVEIDAIGRVEAQERVSVMSQVDGELVGVHFTEGRDVKRGELLFEIDPRPYQRALEQARANLARDRAQADNAVVKLRRVDDLTRQGVESRDDLDQAKTTAAALKATVAADEAAVETAKLQLHYTAIRSPIDGRTGALLVHRGNVVKARDTALVVINRISPICVSFSVPESDLPEIENHRVSGRPLTVGAEVPQDEGPASEGILSFVDNGVDATTGTILLKATFANRDGRLWPGQFVNVALELTTEPHALVVPSAAVEVGPDGQYLFVVSADDTAKMEPVVLERTVGDKAVVKGKLEAGDRVVTDGQLRLVSGAAVEIQKGDQAASSKEAKARTP
jgi:membrane fusion protein, multidrug efflux system